MAEEEKKGPKNDDKELIEGFCSRIAKFIGLKKPEDVIKIKKVFETDENK